MGKSIRFLDSGGTLGKLIKDCNWYNTDLGPIEEWPQSLLTTLSILLHSKLPMFLLWGAKNSCFYNDAYLPNLPDAGLHPTLIGSPIEKVWPQGWMTIKDKVNAVYDTGQSIRKENKEFILLRHGKSEKTSWNYSYTPVFNELGNIGGVIIISEETTQTTQTLSNLTLSEERFRNLIRDTSTGIVLLQGNELKVEIVNDAYAKLIDRTAAQIIGKPLFSIIPEAAQEFKPMLANVMATGESISLTEQRYFVYNEKGEEIEGFVNLLYQPYREKEGNITGVMAILQDITEQIVAKKKLEESEQRTRSIIESAPFPIGVYEGKDMRIQFVNQAIMDAWGKGPDVIGKTYANVLPELASQQIYEQLDSVYSTGIAYHAKNQRVDLEIDGELESFYFNYSFTPLFTPEGKVYGVMNTAADVTELQKAKESVETNNQQLLRINNDLDNFIYAASHDLKAPISNIEGLLHALLRSLPKSAEELPRINSIMAMMQSSVDRFKQTIGNLTEVVKLQKESTLEANWIELPKVVEGVLQDLEPEIDQGKAQIHLKLEECQPIRFPEKNLRSIVYNLVSNALKYSTATRQPDIEIKYSCTPGFHVLSIADNGLGLTPDNIKQLFTMFKRLHSHVEGTGIGLYMIKKMIENAGGTIEVKSQLDVGTTFKVYFPK